MVAEYKLFPGCLISNRLPFLESSARFVFETLGVGLSDAEWGCCPNPVGMKPVDIKTWNVLAARNLVVAEQDGKSIMSLCNGCYQSLAMVNRELHHDEVLKKNVNSILAKVGKEYKGSIDVKHFVHVLVEEVGLDKIRAACTTPLTGIKVACHPGCHYLRPEYINHDDPWEPKYLHQLVECTGATVVDYDDELLCCGNVERNFDEKIANNILKSKLDSAMEAGAECLAVNCPACFQQFDNEQAKLKDLAPEGVQYKFPIYFITELLAMAMGKDPKEMGISFHRNKGNEVLGKVGLSA
jgi:heterodisulfide reductase subunit B